MSEFDEALAEAVQDGIARGGLPGAADAIRRGRRRSLRARGGVTMLGVAVVAGAIGGAGMLGGRAGSAEAASGLGGHAGEGVLPAPQWPGYDLEHWTVSPHCGLADRSKCKPGDPTDGGILKQVQAGQFVGGCIGGTSFPVQRYAEFTTQYDTARQLDADEQVLTFANETDAGAFMAQARAAGSPTSCPGVSGVRFTPGVSTVGGISWVTTRQEQDVVSYTHNYLVQAEDRVALIRVDQMKGDTLKSTAGDAKVLADMQQALVDR